MSCIESCRGIDSTRKVGLAIWTFPSRPWHEVRLQSMVGRTPRRPSVYCSTAVRRLVSLVGAEALPHCPAIALSNSSMNWRNDLGRCEQSAANACSKNARTDGVTDDASKH